jgi:hypothetical protein
MYWYILMKNVCLSILDVTVNAFKLNWRTSTWVSWISMQKFLNSRSPWTFCLLHPLAHSLSHGLSASEQFPRLPSCSEKKKPADLTHKFANSFWGFFFQFLVHGILTSARYVLLYTSGRCGESSKSYLLSIIDKLENSHDLVQLIIWVHLTGGILNLSHKWNPRSK